MEMTGKHTSQRLPRLRRPACPASLWSFVAESSERFVPQVVQGIVQPGSDEGDNGKGKSQS